MNRRFFLIILAAFAILVCNYTFVFSNSKIVDEILKMHDSGLGEETILMYLQSRNADFELTSEDLITLRKAGFSEQFIQALLQFRKMPDYDGVPQMYDYGASYFSFFFGFNYSCSAFYQTAVPSALDPKRYFYSGGHAYVRHNGHFHVDDQHRFQTVPNLSQLPENAFINQLTNSLRGTNRTSVSNRWSSNSKTAIRPKWGTATSSKSTRSAGRFGGSRSRPTNKIGFSQSKSAASSNHK
jgi:hypothetical protein